MLVTFNTWVVRCQQYVEVGMQLRERENELKVTGQSVEGSIFKR